MKKIKDLKFRTEGKEEEEELTVYVRDYTKWVGAYWLERANKELPKVGSLYRVKEEGVKIFRVLDGDKFLRMGRLSEGSIVMVVWVEDPKGYAQKVVKTGLNHTLPPNTHLAFEYKLLVDSQVWNRCSCLIDKWPEHFEEIKTG